MQSHIKFIGSVLIVASCSGMGFQLAHGFRCRIRQCQQVEQCLQRLLGEIRFHQIPLEEALRKTGQAFEGVPFAACLLKIAHGLSLDFSLGKEETRFSENSNRMQPESQTLAQIWQRELERYLEMSLLQEEQEWLISLGRELGALDLEAQIRSLQHCLEQWNRQIETLQQREVVQGRLYRGMGVSIGAFLAILLL